MTRPNEIPSKKWAKHSQKVLKGKSLTNLRINTNYNTYSIDIGGNEKNYVINLIKVENATFEAIGWPSSPEGWPSGKITDLFETKHTLFLNKKVISVYADYNSVRIQVGFYNKKSRKKTAILTGVFKFDRVDNVVLVY